MEVRGRTRGHSDTCQGWGPGGGSARLRKLPSTAARGGGSASAMPCCMAAHCGSKSARRPGPERGTPALRRSTSRTLATSTRLHQYANSSA
jgi:hypothetical protein